MKHNNYLDILSASIDKKGEISPFLFMWHDLVKVNFEVRDLIDSLFEKYKVDKNAFYLLEDNGENISIEDSKILVSKSLLKSQYKFQIFLIENISRLTIKASNALLKFLEEPGEGNLIFLTNKWENEVLDTILSRVQTININSKSIDYKNLVYYDLIDDYIKLWDIRLFSYFYNAKCQDGKKLEKVQYIDFLKTLIKYIVDNKVFIELLDELNEDINAAEKNNVNPKYLVDKYIFRLWK